RPRKCRRNREGNVNPTMFFLMGQTLPGGGQPLPSSLTQTRTETVSDEKQPLQNPAMLRSMLVGLDGSTSSPSAVELGLGYALRFDALLVGLGIIDEPTICRPEPVGIWGSFYKQRRDAHRLADARCQVKGFLEQFTSRCAGAGVACQVLEDV